MVWVLDFVDMKIYKRNRLIYEIYTDCLIYWNAFLMMTSCTIWSNDRRYNYNSTLHFQFMEKNTFHERLQIKNQYIITIKHPGMSEIASKQFEKYSAMNNPSPFK